MRRRIEFGVRIHQARYRYESLKKIRVEADKHRKLQDYIDIGITCLFLPFPDPVNSDMSRLLAGEVMSSFR